MGKQQRKFGADFKARVALEAIKGSQTFAQLTSHYKVHTSQISKWKKQALSGLVEIFKKGSQNKGSDNHQGELDELYQQIGKLQVENAFLKKSVYPNGL
jgi:transposase-like protein